MSSENEQPWCSHFYVASWKNEKRTCRILESCKLIVRITTDKWEKMGKKIAVSKRRRPFESEWSLSLPTPSFSVFLPLPWRLRRLIGRPPLYDLANWLAILLRIVFFKFRALSVKFSRLSKRHSNLALIFYYFWVNTHHKCLILRCLSILSAESADFLQKHPSCSWGR